MGANLKIGVRAGAVTLGLLVGWIGAPATDVPASAAEPARAAQAVQQLPVRVTASGYRLRTIRVNKRIRTPQGHSFPADVSYPQLSGGKAKWRAKFNRAVRKSATRLLAEQADSIDGYEGTCRDMAAMSGGWTGGILDGHYASILLDWDRGSCGGVSWNSGFGSVTMSIKSGKLHSLPYMMAKLGGRANWDTAGALVAQQAGDCAESWDSVTPYKPAGWRVDGQALHLAFERYQIGYGACGSPTYALAWPAYRAELAYH